jgi:hypothetical protein
MIDKKQIIMLLLLPPLFAFIHWIGVRIYSNYCSPSGFIGLITTIFNTANPFCLYIFTILEHTKNFYINAWIVVGVASFGLLNMIFTICRGSTDVTSSPEHN